MESNHQLTRKRQRRRGIATEKCGVDLCNQPCQCRPVRVHVVGFGLKMLVMGRGVDLCSRPHRCRKMTGMMTTLAMRYGQQTLSLAANAAALVPELGLGLQPAMRQYQWQWSSDWRMVGNLPEMVQGGACSRDRIPKQWDRRARVFSFFVG